MSGREDQPRGDGSEPGPAGGRVRLGWVSGLILMVVTVLFAYPFLWMALAAFKSNPEIYRPLQFWPEAIRWDYFGALFRGEWFPFWTVLANSLVVSLLQSAGAVAWASMAGYVFAWHRVRGGHFLFGLALVAIVIPLQTLAVPLFTWMSELGLANRLAGVILPGMVSGLGVLYFSQVFRRVPGDLLEAARLEGASEMRVYWMVLPLVRGGLISFGLVHFILSWHEHLIPLLVLSSPAKQTLPLALAWLNGAGLNNPVAVLMAGSTVAVLPAAILYGMVYRKFRGSLADLMAS